MNRQIVFKQILKKIYKPRPKQSHKKDFGYVLVIGGNKCYSGAPALVALAAYKTGSDLVTVYAPERPANIIAGFDPSIITCPLKGDYLSLEHKKNILNILPKYDALVIGNGAGENPKTIKLFKRLIKETKIPIVVDADGLQALNKNIVKNQPIIATPHIKEFEGFTGIKLNNLSLKEKIKKVKKVGQDFNITILLKGDPDIISNGKNTFINKTGNPYMTVGGTGDVLAGICGSMLARGIEPIQAAKAGAYLCGKAGERASKKLKESLMAKDVIQEIKN